MQLSLKDRIIIANQCRILEKLYPDEADEYARYRTAIESGYEYDYDNPPGDYSGHMKASASKEVIDILSMHRALRFSFDRLEDNFGIDEDKIKFAGFDGNEEASYLGYARHICHDHGQERWRELYDVQILNSHSPKIDVYRAMLQEWQLSENRHELTREDIFRIISAQPY